MPKAKNNMSWELFTKQLEEISEKIHQLELKEVREDHITHPDADVYFQRKAVWKTLKSDIERKLDLVKSEIVSNSEEKGCLIFLASKFSSHLTKVEEKINNLETNLEQLKILARRTKGFEVIILVTSIITLLSIVIYEFIGQSSSSFLNWLVFTFIVVVLLCLLGIVFLTRKRMKKQRRKK